MSKHIDVVVGVIECKLRGFLIAKRHGEQHLAGLWEFPGGKVEPGETFEKALARELKEELAIDVSDYEPFCEINYDYPEKSVSLRVFLVHSFVGEAVGSEGQEIRWVSKSELPEYQFPPANAPIIERLIPV